MIVYRELSSLERDLGFRAGTLYAVSNRLSRHYHSVRLPKKGGGERLLSVPDPQLKAIQRRIAQVLLPLMPVSAYARAYRDGASTRHNALPHVGQPLVLKLDICHFFDAIRYSQVKEAAFPADMYAEPIRVLLAMLCYYKDALPQGAPTSPAVSNIILYDFDEKVGAWCRSRGIAYTRYCDDLTFSGDFDPRVVRAYIEGELRALGFLLNGQKTRIQFRSKRQSVTGLVVNDRAAVPRDYRRSLRQQVYFCRKFGVEDHLAKTGCALPRQEYLMGLLGRVQYVLSVEPGNQEMADARDWIRGELRKK